MDRGDEFGLLTSRRHGHPVERIIDHQSNVDEDPRRVLVEVQERLGPSVEHARSLFDQSVDRAKLIEKCGQSFEGGLRSVLHRGECSATVIDHLLIVFLETDRYHLESRQGTMDLLRLLT